jgi:hypothetical protein
VIERPYENIAQGRWRAGTCPETGNIADIYSKEYIVGTKARARRFRRLGQILVCKLGLAALKPCDSALEITVLPVANSISLGCAFYDECIRGLMFNVAQAACLADNNDRPHQRVVSLDLTCCGGLPFSAG